MAAGLSSDYDLDFLTKCTSCDVDQSCCDESCEARIWVGPCGSIDYSTGELANIADFCEPPSVTAFSFTDNATVREKQYRNCKKSRRRGQPDLSFSLTWDICQSERSHGILLGRCPFDYVIAPKGNNLNFELNPSIFDQQTMVLWGRVVGDSNTWDFPDDDCQTTTRTFMTDLFCWMTDVESLLQDGEAAAVALENANQAGAVGSGFLATT